MRALLAKSHRFTIILILAFIFTSPIVTAQINYQWVWQGGIDSTGQPGNYGTKGIPGSSNVPGARFTHISWTGMDGNLWLMGGIGYDKEERIGDLNDLWCYDITTREWTWVSGSDAEGQQGIYGIKGISGSLNVPGVRFSTISWTGPDGDLWLMGGFGRVAGNSGYLNDLWRYEIVTDEWTWISGSDDSGQAGFYGTKGISGNSNVPGARYNSISWTSLNGDLWLMGGEGYDTSGSLGQLNDLWRFDTDSGEWTWISGSPESNQAGSYGTKGVFGSSNIPGARNSAISWTSPDGDLWLMGGEGYDATGVIGQLNDLWRFDITTGEWVWVSGSALRNQWGTYGLLSVPSGTNVPGARSGAVSWTNPNGDLWLMGGEGYDATGEIGQLNDLWRFDITTGEWTWISGSDVTGQPGSYGNKGIPGSSNVPGARGEAVSWTGPGWDLWMMGGIGIDAFGNDGGLNDLWQLVSEPGVANFDGTSSFGRVKDSEELSVEGKTEFTVEVWLNIRALNNDASILGIVNRGQFLNAVGFSYQDASTGIDLFFNHRGVSTNSSGFGFTSFSWENITPGKWYHLAGTYDGSNTRVYLDGQLVTDSLSSGALSDPSSGSSDIYFGYEALLGTYLDGKLAEVRIWEKALTQQEIQANMNLSVSGNEPTLMGAWLSKAGGSHSAVDQSGSGNNMAASNVSYTSDFPPIKATVAGGEGWRFLGAPGENVSYDELLDLIWTQGYLESDGGEGIASNVYYYDESNKSWGVPNSSSNTIGTNSDISSGIGKGALVHVYADDNNDGIDDPFPKELNLNSYSPSLQNLIPLSFTESGFLPSDGWNLVSNPYPVAIYWGDVVNNGNNQGMLDYAYIWDHTMNNGAGGYQVHFGEPVPPAFPGANNDFDGRIPAFQSFWVKAEQEGATLKLQRSDFTLNRNLYKIAPQQSENNHIKFTLEGQGFTDELSVIIPASEEQLREEVPKLNSLSGQYAEIFLPGEQGSRWMTRHINSIEKDVPVIIPIDFNASVPGEFSLSWTTESVTEEWSAWLLDKQRGQRYDLSKNSEIIIESESSISEKSKELVLPIAPGSQNKQKNATPRFELILTSSVTTGVDLAGDIPDEFNISQNYPNPFNPTTQINYAVPQAADIQLVVYDMLGRKVATLVDERLSPGSYSVNFDASKLASGIYIYRLQSGSIVLTKMMTLIK